MRDGDMIPGKGQLVVTAEALSGIVTELMRPVMETLVKMLENNTAALEQLSSAQAVQNDRLEALEKQIRLQTPGTARPEGRGRPKERDEAGERDKARGAGALWHGSAEGDTEARIQRGS